MISRKQTTRAQIEILPPPIELTRGTPWIAEALRATISRMYAETGGEPVHRTAITSHVSKAFLSTDVDTLLNQPSSIFDILVVIEDVADVGNGYYMPRESRVTRLSPSFGRIAGGLPYEHSEHPDSDEELLKPITIGRIVRLDPAVSVDPDTVEYSSVIEWTKQTPRWIYERLIEELPRHGVSRPIEHEVYFYHADPKRGYSRRDRWRTKEPKATFGVARCGMSPVHYFLFGNVRGRSDHEWIELTKEAARKWILLMERTADIRNRMQTIREGSQLSFTLPDMLPREWTSAILACATDALVIEKGWRVTCDASTEQALTDILTSANIELS